MQLCHACAKIGSRGAGVMEQHADEVDSLAIITPYKQQELAMKARFEREKSLHGTPSVYFGTVDGFQVTTFGKVHTNMTDGRSLGSFCTRGDSR